MVSAYVGSPLYSETISTARVCSSGLLVRTVRPALAVPNAARHPPGAPVVPASASSRRRVAGIRPGSPSADVYFGVRLDRPGPPAEWPIATAPTPPLRQRREHSVQPSRRRPRRCSDKPDPSSGPPRTRPRPRSLCFAGFPECSRGRGRLRGAREERARGASNAGATERSEGATSNAVGWGGVWTSLVPGCRVQTASTINRRSPDRFDDQPEESRPLRRSIERVQTARTSTFDPTNRRRAPGQFFSFYTVILCLLKHITSVFKVLAPRWNPVWFRPDHGSESLVWLGRHDREVVWIVGTASSTRH